LLVCLGNLRPPVRTFSHAPCERLLVLGFSVTIALSLNDQGFALPNIVAVVARRRRHRRIGPRSHRQSPRNLLKLYIFGQQKQKDYVMTPTLTQSGLLAVLLEHQRRKVIQLAQRGAHRKHVRAAVWSALTWPVRKRQQLT